MVENTDSAGNVSENAIGSGQGKVNEVITGNGTPKNAGITHDVGSVATQFQQPERKKRGRKPGQQNKPKDGGAAQKEKLDIELLARQIGAFHATIAILSGRQEILLSDDENKLLATAIDGVLQHYAVSVPPKITSMINLIATCALIYIPRMALIASIKQAEKKQKQSANVSPINSTIDFSGLQ